MSAFRAGNHLYVIGRIAVIRKNFFNFLLKWVGFQGNRNNKGDGSNYDNGYSGNKLFGFCFFVVLFIFRELVGW